jgi:hypothetical protein
MVAAGEYVVTDLADRVVQAVQGISDPLRGRVMGQLDRGLQAARLLTFGAVAGT